MNKLRQHLHSQQAKVIQIVSLMKAKMQNDNQNYTVYKTRTGSKYHSSGCRYLKKSCYETTVSQARNEGLTPCSVCNP